MAEFGDHIRDLIETSIEPVTMRDIRNRTAAGTRSSNTSPRHSRRWMAIAAAGVLVVGSGALALALDDNDDDPSVIITHGPSTIAPAGTTTVAPGTPTTELPATTTAVPSPTTTTTPLQIPSSGIGIDANGVSYGTAGIWFIENGQLGERCCSGPESLAFGLASGRVVFEVDASTGHSGVIYVGTKADGLPLRRNPVTDQMPPSNNDRLLDVGRGPDEIVWALVAWKEGTQITDTVEHLVLVDVQTNEEREISVTDGWESGTRSARITPTGILFNSYGGVTQSVGFMDFSGRTLWQKDGRPDQDHFEVAYSPETGAVIVTVSTDTRIERVSLETGAIESSMTIADRNLCLAQAEIVGQVLTCARNGTDERGGANGSKITVAVDLETGEVSELAMNAWFTALRD